MTAPTPYEKPSRQNRRQKRTWKRKKPAHTGLTLSTNARHHPDRLQTTGNGIGVPDEKGGCVRRSGGFFTSIACVAPSMAGRVGEPQGSPVPFSRYANPARARHPDWRRGAGFRPLKKEHRTMRHLASGTPARTLKHRFTLYRTLRLFVRPALAFRLIFSGRAAA